MFAIVKMRMMMDDLSCQYWVAILFKVHLFPCLLCFLACCVSLPVVAKGVSVYISTLLLLTVSSICKVSRNSGLVLVWPHCQLYTNWKFDPGNFPLIHLLCPLCLVSKYWHYVSLDYWTYRYFVSLPAICQSAVVMLGSCLFSPLPFASLILLIQWYHYLAYSFGCGLWMSLWMQNGRNTPRFSCQSIWELRWQSMFSVVFISWECRLRSSWYFLISSSRAITASINITVKIGVMNFKWICIMKSLILLSKLYFAWWSHHLLTSLILFVLEQLEIIFSVWSGYEVSPCFSLV